MARVLKNPWTKRSIHSEWFSTVTTLWNFTDVDAQFQFGRLVVAWRYSNSSSSEFQQFFIKLQKTLWNFQPKESRVTVKTLFLDTRNVIESTLRFDYVTWQDSGTYTCLQPSVRKDSMKLFVVEGKSICCLFQIT